MVSGSHIENRGGLKLRLVGHICCVLGELTLTKEIKG